MPNAILLSVREQFERELPLTDGQDVTPGMLCEFAGTTSVTIQAHSADDEIPSPLIVAVESPWRSGSGIDDAYDQNGERVEFHYLLSGDRYYALLAPGEIVDSYADRLQSNGDGTLKIGTTLAFARPLELVDNTYGAENVRIRVEVL